MLLTQESKPLNMEIDYSKVEGERILPFLIVLDETESILEPSPEENQRFWYTVSGVGWDDDVYDDLYELVIGLDEPHLKDQIINLTVFLDGVEQELFFGKNGNAIWLSGLLLRFDVDKVDGELDISFELKSPCSLGSVPIRLEGVQDQANSLSICGPVPQNSTLPIESGSPVISSTNADEGETSEGSYTFLVKQEKSVAPPIELAATAIIGEPFIEAGQVLCQTCEESPQ